MKMMANFKFLKSSQIEKLPQSPGVYSFRDKAEKFLYIGKATNLKRRVRNHFQKPGFKENLWLNKTKEIGYKETASEIEALILESNLIKKYQPQYNIVWRDDKNYFFVGITKEDFPRVFITHQLKLKQSTINNQQLTIDYMGPFVDGKALKKALKVLRKVFPYRSCKTFPKRPCLWYQLGRCLAPCLLKSKLGQQIPPASQKMRKECQANVTNLQKILQGKKTQVLKNLKREMKKTAKSKEFERAAKIRDKIFALEKTIVNSKIFEVSDEKIQYSKIEKALKKLLKTQRKIKRIEAYDVSNISGKSATGAMISFINGIPAKEFYRKFKIKISGKPNDIAMIKEILSRRLKHPEWGWPDLILIDGGRAQLNAVFAVLKSKRILAAAIAKRKNELYIKGKRPILLKTLPREIFNLILQLRDEAHRFASSYHKKLREKELLTSD